MEPKILSLAGTLDYLMTECPFDNPPRNQNPNFKVCPGCKGEIQTMYCPKEGKMSIFTTHLPWGRIGCWNNREHIWDNYPAYQSDYHVAIAGTALFKAVDDEFKFPKKS